MTFVKKLVTFVTAAFFATIFAGAAQAQAKEPDWYFSLPAGILKHNVLLTKTPSSRKKVDLGEDLFEFTDRLDAALASKKDLKLNVSSEEMCVWVKRGRTEYLSLNLVYSFENNKGQLVVMRYDMTQILKPEYVKFMSQQKNLTCNFTKMYGVDVVGTYSTLPALAAAN